ncbi:TPA: hypothetical protein ACV74K_004109, partial [Escherichia coli]
GSGKEQVTLARSTGCVILKLSGITLVVYQRIHSTIIRQIERIGLKFDGGTADMKHESYLSVLYKDSVLIVER